MSYSVVVTLTATPASAGRVSALGVPGVALAVTVDVDAKVALPDPEVRIWEVPPTLTVALEVAEGILSQGFEPTPTFAACSICDYRLVCPAAER